MSKEVVNKTVYSKLNTKLKNFEKKITDACILFGQTNTTQINIISGKKLETFKTNKLTLLVLVNNTVPNTKIGEIESKIPVTSGLVNT